MTSARATSPPRRKRCLRRASSSTGWKGLRQVVEEIFTEVERSEMSTTDQQQHRTDMDVTATDRPAQAKGLVGFIAGHDDRRPAVGGLLASRRVEIAAASRPATPGREPGRARVGRGGRREADPSSSPVAEVALEFEGVTLDWNSAHSARLLRRNHSKTCSPRVSRELGLLHHVERLVRANGERLDPKGATLAVGKFGKEVGVGLGGKLVALLDAAEAGGEDQRESEVRVGGTVERRYSMRPIRACPSCGPAPGSWPSGCCGPRQHSGASEVSARRL